MEAPEEEVVAAGAGEARLLALLELFVLSPVKEDELDWVFWAQHILAVLDYLPRTHFASVADN